ncbi:MAG: NlpC/P60 family protein [Ignavibacteriales bacterium]
MRRSILVLFAMLMITLLYSSEATAANNTYIIKAGDNLWNIANKYNISVDSIKSANNLQNISLQIGDKLIIPTSNSSNNSNNQKINTSAAGYTAPGNQKVYYVQAGDSLWKIATLHGMTVAELKALNIGCNENLKIGQKLVVNGEARNSQPVSRGSVPSGGGGTSIIQKASQFIGTPYAYGGTGPGGFDCSGFTRYIYAEAGYNLPHNAAAQSGVGKPVAREELQSGDLVFFAYSGGGIFHVGIYCGDGRFIHSSSPRSGGVIYSSLTDSYWGGYYISATRIINE